MLSLNDIKNLSLETTRGGYRKEGVEEFVSQVVELVTALENEKADMQKKIVILAEKIEEYKRDEENIKQVLVGAQRMAEQDGYKRQKLAGVPNPIIKRAYEILTQLEGDSPQQERKQAVSRPVQQPEGGQLDFGASRDSEVAERLRELDINVLTPIEALNLLSELHSLAGK